MPKNAKPVTRWTNRDEAFLDIAEGIRRAVEELLPNDDEEQTETVEEEESAIASQPSAIPRPPVFGFVAYFLRYAVERKGPMPENYDALEEERDNLLRAAEAAFASGDWGSVTRMAYALANPVNGLLCVRGYCDEAVRLGEQALQAARSLQDEATIAGLSHNLAAMYQQ